MADHTTFHTNIIAQSKSIPQVIQFYANWCGPCQSLKPLLEKIAKVQADLWELVKINVEEMPELASFYQVRSIPTVIMLYNGEVIARFIGAKPPYIIQNWLDNNLPKPEQAKEDDPLNIALRKGDIPSAKENILDRILDEYKDSSLLKLFKSIDSIGKNNNVARSFLEKVRRDGPLSDIVKKVRDLIDQDEDEKDVHTPGHNPFQPTIKNMDTKIDISHIDFDLLTNLVLQQINEVRNQQGVADLKPHHILQSAANDHTKYQTKSNQLTHYQQNPEKKTVKDRIRFFGGTFSLIGENVQYKGFPVRQIGHQKQILSDTYRNTAKSLCENWVNSPGHYKNMINPDYQYSGLSIDWNPENAAFFATQVFA